MISHDKHQTQFWILSGPGAVIGCVLLSESKMIGEEKEGFGGLRYVAVGSINLGKGRSVTSSMLHGAVAVGYHSVPL